jgi:hypothetical protein
MTKSNNTPTKRAQRDYSLGRKFLGVVIDLVLRLLYAARPFMLPTFSIALSVFA